MTRDRSYAASVSSGSAMIRCSITGITTSDSHRSDWVTSRQSSGSKRRRSTTVDPSSIEIARWAKPHVWNSGAAMWVRQPWRRGIRESSDTAAPMPASLRGAPFGVPVVPDVRITIRACRLGGSRSWSGCPAISASRVSSPTSLSVQATIRSLTSASESRSANSSSWITAAGRSRSRTSTSWGPANAVLR